MKSITELAKRFATKEEESATALPSYDVEKGKQGYQQYLNYLEFEKSERERKAAEAAEARKNETFWETLGRYLGSGGATDTSLSMNQGMNQAIDYYQNHYDPSSDTSRRPQDDWTDEERWAFGAKYLEDEASAFDYAAELNKQHQKKKLETWTNKNPINKVAGTVGSIGLNIVGGGVGFLDSLAQKAARGEIVNHGVLYPHEVSGTIQETVATGLNEKYGTVNFLGGERGWGDVYGLGTSVVQSIAAGALGGGGGTLVSFFGMAASQGVTDAKSRGATDEQAIGFGIVSGLAEAIPEMISVGKLFSLRKASSVKNFFRQVLSQAGEEAGEEFTTSLINEVADRFIMDGKSNYNMLVQQYLASGMPLKEAQNKAISDTLKGFAYDAISGFLSGGVSGGLMVGGKTLANRIDGKANAQALEQLQPKQNELIEEGKKYKPTEKRAAHLEKKIAEGKEASGYKLRMLASEISNASRDADVDTLRKAIVQKMKDEGLNDSQAKRLGEIALNKALGNEVSLVQNAMLKNNDSAMKIYNQMDTDNMLSGYADSEWTKATPLAKLKAESGELQKGLERNLANAKVEYDQSKIVDKSGKAIFEKSSADSKIHLDGISSELTKNNVAELKAIEKIANELGVNIHVYETMLDKNGDRVYIDKDGNKITSSGYYDPKDKSIHIDLRAGNKGEGTMLYTASHELVHYMKDISKEHYDALEQLVTDELIKGGKSIEALMEAQRQKALENGQNLTDDEIREEMIADACQSFLASKSAIADIKALKTKNKSLWTALKKFFTTLFTKLNKIYKTVDPDSAEGKYIADMRNSVKKIRDAFIEGVTAASENSTTKKASDNNSEAKSENKTVKSQARKNTQESVVERYKKRLDSWDGKTVGFSFVMGTAPSFLANIEIEGIKIGKRQVRIDATKVKNILNTHPEMSVDIFKQLPDLLYSPIVILDSKTVKGRLVMIGEVYANETPVTMVLEVNPSTKDGNSTYVDVIKVASAYTRSNTQNLINSSNIRYISKNKDRVNNWLKVNRLQLPLPSPQSNSVIDDSIPQTSEKVNISAKKSSYRNLTSKQDSAGNELTAEQQEYFKDSVVRDSKGNLMVLYHGTTADFNEFKKGDVGFHFGTKGAARGRVGYGKNVTLKEVYLNITNPIVFDDDLGSWDADYRLTRELYDRGILTQAEAETVLLTDSKQYRRTTEAANKKLVEVLLAKGYDGIEYTNTHESKKNSTSYIVFESNQAKDITNKTPTKNADIRHSGRKKVDSRAKYTAGQMAQTKANLSHSKVYTKESAMKLVKELAPNIRNRSFEALSDELWRGLNTYVTLDDKTEFASDMAQQFVDRMMVDTLEKNPAWEEATEKIAYIKSGINRLSFMPDELTELEHILDKDGLKRLRSRWGFKSKAGVVRSDYPLDVFITDISREMPGMEHLADMHPAEALIEIDSLYNDLSDTIKNKYEKTYEGVPEEFIADMKKGIEGEILKAYRDLGEKTKIAKYLAEKFDAYNERIEYWKAEHSKVKDISRWNGILSTKAMHIRDLKKGAFFNATQHKQDIFKDSIEKLSQIQWRGNISPNSIRRIFGELKEWYTKDNPMLYSEKNEENLYSDTIAKYIETIADTSKGKFEPETYAMVYDVMNHLYTMMRNYNKIFRDGRWQDAEELAKNYIAIMEKTKNGGLVKRAVDGYEREFLEPMAVAKKADGYDPNGFFTRTVEDLRQASIAASVGEMKLRKLYDAFIDKNKKYLVNAAKEKVEYRGQQIPKLHLIGLYMTMKREHARAGLALNGFEFTVKNKWWDSEDRVYIPGYVADSDTLTQKEINEATEAQMRTIEQSFTNVDRQYILVLEGLFNGELKNLKVERDMERQGYTNATLDYYYPIMRGAMAENIDTAKFSDQNRATNASFNKNTVKGARQRLVIISADAMVNRHITDMCKYYYMSQAIENYNMLYNIDVSGNPNNPKNIATIVKDGKVWDNDVAYFRKLVSDMQGIRDSQSEVQKIIEKLRGNYASFALGLNVKVLATQFSSMIAAGDVIGFGSIVSPKTLHQVTSADIEKYCPMAAVRSYDKTVLKAMSVTDKLGKLTKAFSIGISKVDDFVIRRLFASCQVEAQKRGLGNLGTEENKIAAGKLLEDVIIQTQQNAYATERSNAMRSSSEIMKAVTMFTADAMKIYSRMHEAFGEYRAARKSGDKAKIKAAKKQFAKSVTVATLISAYMTGIAMLFRWVFAKDDEEDENVLLSVGLDLVGNFIGALPLISDAYDYMVNGYEIESVTFDTINNLFGAINNIRKDLASMITGSGERSMQDINRDLRSLLYGVGQALGIPFRNVYNLTRGIIDKFSSTATYRLDAKFYETSLATDLQKSIEKGDNATTEYIMDLMFDKRISETLTPNLRSEIIRLAKLEYKVLPREIPDEITRNGKTYELTATQKDTLMSEYGKVVEALAKLVQSSFYTARSDKDKAYLVDYYYDKYYDMAVNKALGLTDKDKPIYNGVGFSTYAKLEYLTKNIKADKDKNGNTISGSKKAKLIEIVNKQKISTEKKLLYVASQGYKISDGDIDGLSEEMAYSKLLKYINGLKLTTSSKLTLAEKCGFEIKNGKIVPK